MQRPREQDYATPTGFKLAKEMYDRWCQNKIMEAATSTGKVTKGYDDEVDYPKYPSVRDFDSREDWQKAMNEYQRKRYHFVNKDRKRKKEAEKKEKYAIYLPPVKRSDFESEELYHKARKERKKEYSKLWHRKTWNLTEGKRELMRQTSRKNPDYPPCPRKGEYPTLEAWNTANLAYLREVSRIRAAKIKAGEPVPMRKKYMAKIKPKVTVTQESNESKAAHASPSVSAVEMARAYLADKISGEKLQQLIDNFIIQLALKEAAKESENIL